MNCAHPPRHPERAEGCGRALVARASTSPCTLAAARRRPCSVGNPPTPSGSSLARLSLGTDDHEDLLLRNSVHTVLCGMLYLSMKGSGDFGKPPNLFDQT
jgi:hypothetical protein